METPQFHTFFEGPIVLAMATVRAEKERKEKFIFK